MKISRLLLIAFLPLATTAKAELKLEKHQQKISGAPVEIFVVQDDGVGAPVEWVAAPLPTAYPAPGQALPELAARGELSAAVNANFYREDKPGAQEPIGLTVHEGQMLSLPTGLYPSVGVIDGHFEWDKVKLEARVEIEAGGKTYKEKLCRLNARASRGCVSLWLNRIPQNLKDAVFVKAPGQGLPLGRKTLALQADAEGAWALQWAGRPWGQATPSKVSVETKLRGERLGSKWETVAEAVSGSHILTAKKTFPSLARSWAMARQPRTLIGETEERKPFLAVFDGRRETSRGVSIHDAWNFLKKHVKASWALNLDGGGSTTLLHEGHLANKPSDGYPRPVAIGWGARARAIRPAPKTD